MKVSNYDVCVIGGGLAGVCAAISAARQGAKTLLLTNRPVLGGNSSSEIRVWTRGATGGGNLFAEEMGIVGELKMHNLYINPSGNPILWDEVLLDAVMKEENITLLLNTHATKVELTNGESIHYIEAIQFNSETHYRIFSKQYIDASGDGSIAYACGLDFMKGKEDRALFNEKFAKEKGDSSTLGSSLLMCTKRTQQPVKFIAPHYAYSLEHIERVIGSGGRVVNEKMSGSDYWWVEYGGNKNTILDDQEIMIELRRIIYGIWNYIKNSGKFDADYLTLEWVGTVSGKRESRRFKTEHILTDRDVFEKPIFDDVVFYGGWYLDFHPAGGFYSKSDFCTQIPTFVYPIPLRVLFNQKVNNLFLAGRDIGTTHSAFASTRIMNTCGLSGQASGLAAATCALKGINNNQISSIDVKKIQQLLLKEDMWLLGISNDDPFDLAKKAKIRVSSSLEHFEAKISKHLQLAKEVCIHIPSAVLEKSHLVFESSVETVVNVKYHYSDVPSKLILNQQIATKEVKLVPGFNKIGFEVIDLYDGFYTLVLEPNPNVVLFLSDQTMTGVVVNYLGSHHMYYPALISEGLTCFSGNQLTNGFNRPYKGLNMWVSGDEVSPSVTIDFESVQSVREIRLYLNPNLSQDLFSSHMEHVEEHHNAYIRHSMPSELVKNFQIFAFIDGEYELIREVSENYDRLVKISVKDVYTKQLKIVFLESYGKKNIEIFEIRVY